jgi:putative YphP/YqiW family bacilliredoxin
MYDQDMTRPMEAELETSGIIPLHSTEEVDKALKEKNTSMILINSVCGCAAKNARPGVKLSLKHSKIPEKLFTVFAGVDKEATEQARTYISQEPSSPSIGIFKDGNNVFFMSRQEIQNKEPQEIAQILTKAYDDYC